MLLFSYEASTSWTRLTPGFSVHYLNWSLTHEYLVESFWIAFLLIFRSYGSAASISQAVWYNQTYTRCPWNHDALHSDEQTARCTLLFACKQVLHTCERKKKYKHTVYGFNLKREYFYCRDLKLSGPHMKEICQHDSLGLNCPDVNYKAECFC